MRALERRLESGSIRLAPLSLWIALFLAVAAPVAAQQPLETWGFEGQILSVSDINDLLFTPLPEVGSTISGVFSFDPSLPDGNADPTVGQYDNAVRCVNVFVGDNEILLSPPGPVSASATSSSRTVSSIRSASS